MISEITQASTASLKLCSSPFPPAEGSYRPRDLRHDEAGIYLSIGQFLRTFTYQWHISLARAADVSISVFVATVEVWGRERAVP